MTYFMAGNLPRTEMFPGIQRRAVWLDGVMLTFFSFDPHAIVPEHAHPNEQITFVTSGSMEFTLAGEKRRLNAGDGVCIPPNVPHSAKILEEPAEAIDAWNPPREDYKA